MHFKLFGKSGYTTHLQAFWKCCGLSRPFGLMSCWDLHTQIGFYRPCRHTVLVIPKLHQFNSEWIFYIPKSNCFSWKVLTFSLKMFANKAYIDKNVPPPTGLNKNSPLPPNVPDPPPQLVKWSLPNKSMSWIRGGEWWTNSHVCQAAFKK